MYWPQLYAALDDQAFAPPILKAELTEPRAGQTFPGFDAPFDILQNQGYATPVSNDVMADRPQNPVVQHDVFFSGDSQQVLPLRYDEDHHPVYDDQALDSILPVDMILL